MYDEAMGGIKKHLIGQTKKSGLIFTQELIPAKHPRSGEQSAQSLHSMIQADDCLVQDLAGRPEARSSRLFPWRVIHCRRHRRRAP